MKKPKPATAGEKIAASVWFCKIMNGNVPPTLDDQETLMRRIDAAIRRAVRKERERCIACQRAAGYGVSIGLMYGSKP